MTLFRDPIGVEVRVFFLDKRPESLEPLSSPARTLKKSDDSEQKIWGQTQNQVITFERNEKVHFGRYSVSAISCFQTLFSPQDPNEGVPQEEQTQELQK